MKKNIPIIVSVILLILIAVGYMWYRSFQVKEGTVKPSEQVTVDNSTAPNKVTEESPTTTAGNSIETPVPGSCLVLEEKYCRTVKSVTVNGNIIAAFKLPTGVPIFSPYAGAVTLGSGGPNYFGKQSAIVVSEGVQQKDSAKAESSIQIAYTGVREKGIESGGQVNKGDILARIGETNLDRSEVLSAYNIYFVFAKNGGSVADNAKTNEVFGISQQ